MMRLNSNFLNIFATAGRKIVLLTMTLLDESDHVTIDPASTKPVILSDVAHSKMNRHKTSLRNFHSDTNLMERFRSASFMVNFIGTSRNFFTLQKRKPKETIEKYSHSSDNIKSKSFISDVSNNKPMSTNELPNLTLSDKDNLVHKPPEQNLESKLVVLPEQLIPSTSSGYLYKSRDQTIIGHHKTIKSKRSSKLKKHSSSKLDSACNHSLKKSWLQPIAFINCCLSRTDSVLDVSKIANGKNEEVSVSTIESSSSKVTSDKSSDTQINQNLFDQVLIHNLNELLNANNDSISLTTTSSEQINAFDQSQQSVSIDVEQPSLNGLVGEDSIIPLPSSTPNHLPSTLEVVTPNPMAEVNELRRAIEDSQSGVVLSSFGQPNSNRLFSITNYPIRMFPSNHVSIERNSTNRLPGDSLSEEVSIQQLEQHWHANTSNGQHSINPNLISPYPPPSLFRSQRNSRTKSQIVPIHTQIDYINCLVPDLSAISNCSFYWGKMDRYEAERLLEGKPEGTFLLRDSAQEDHLFSVSFRRFDRSLHARIEQWKHRFSFDSHDPGVYSSDTVTGLIEHYKDPSHCMFFEPMLTKPLNRNFTFTLAHLARTAICDMISYETVNELPLPIVLKSYLKEYHYRQKVRTKHFDEFTYLNNYYQS